LAARRCTHRSASSSAVAARRSSRVLMEASSSSYKPRKMSNKPQPVLYGPTKRRADAYVLGALCAWLRSHGVECDKTTTYATSERFGALGTAKRDMDEGEAAFSLPLRSRSDGDALALTTRDALGETGALGEVGRAMKKIGGLDRLSGVIESEHEFPLDSASTSTLAVALMRQGAGGKGMRWRAYYDALPGEVDSLLMWSDEELELLQGSALRERALFRRALVRREYEALFPALAEADPEVFGDERYSLEYFRWAYATVMARAFVLPDLKCMALLPGIDVYNSARDAEKCEVEMDDDDDDDDGEDDLSKSRVTLRIGIGGVEAGEQIFHDYADHASGGALLEFGFVYHGERERGRGSHTMDVCLKAEHDALSEETRAFLESNDVFTTYGVRKSLTFEISNVGGVYKPALSGLRCVKPEMWKAARALALSPGDPLPRTLEEPLDEHSERRAREIIANTLRAEREKYSDTSVELDERLLAAALGDDATKIEDPTLAARASASATFRRRAAMALEVRIGEKSLLDDVLAHL
jgi:hypothetical protein